MDAMLQCLPRKSIFKPLKLAEISESDRSKLVYDEDYADEKVYLTTDGIVVLFKLFKKKKTQIFKKYSINK